MSTTHNASPVSGPGVWRVSITCWCTVSASVVGSPWLSRNWRAQSALCSSLRALHGQ